MKRALLVLNVLIAACVVHSVNEEGRACDSRSPCTNGRVCVEGACRSPGAAVPDAGSIADAAVDAGTADVDASLPATGIIVPLYIYPSGSAWSPLIDAAQAHSTVRVRAVINPGSGPGDSLNGNYEAGIAQLIDAGIEPLGYVSTRYAHGDAGIDGVETDIARWQSLYPAVKGLFLDAMSNDTETLTYYSSLFDYARAKGFTTIVGNPGTAVPVSFAAVADVLEIYTGAGYPSLDLVDARTAGLDRRGIAMLIFGAPSIDHAFISNACRRVGFIYVTDKSDNPWTAFPSYLDALFSELQ